MIVEAPKLAARPVVVGPRAVGKGVADAAVGDTVDAADGRCVSRVGGVAEWWCRWGGKIGGVVD